MSYTITKLTWSEIVNDIKELTKQLDRPDAIVTIGRGGNIPGTMLGYALGTKTIVNFGVQSYNDDKSVTDIKTQQEPDETFTSKYKNKKVLVVDDLADKGTTLDYVKNYFKERNITPTFCTLYIKNNTKFTPDFYTKTFNSDEWIEFPWDCLTSS